MITAETIKKYESYTQIFGDLLFEPAVAKKFKTVEAVLSDLGSAFESIGKAPPAGIAGIKAADLRQVVEDYLQEQLFQLANIQYLIMEKTGDHGLLGEQRVSISFCRLLQKIPADREVTQYDADDFRQQILKARKDHSLDQLSLPSLEEKANNWELDILGRKIKMKLDEIKKLNGFLLFLSSSKRLLMSYENQKPNFIFGSAKLRKMGHYNLFVFENEDMRSPYSCLSIVASNSRENIAIRKTSCETIFYNKWSKVFAYSANEQKRLLEDEYNNIGETIKLRALEKYGIRSAADIGGKEQLIIDEIVEGILWHEVGHTIVTDNYLEPKYVALGKTFHSFYDDYFTILGEFLADWAKPSKEKQLKSPILFFLEQAAKGDTAKAQRMLEVYLSDNWFLSSEEKEGMLPSQTDILVSAYLNFYDNSNKVMDLAKLQKGCFDLFEKVLQEYKNGIDRVISPINRAIFIIDNKKIGFGEADERIRGILEHPLCKNRWEKENNYEMYYWSNMIKWVKLYSPETFKEMTRILTNSLDDFKKRFLEILVGAENAGKYKHDLRTYLIARMKELGFYTPVVPISNEEAVNMAIDDSFLPIMQKDEVLGWFKDILGGKARKVSINYNGEPDMSLMVLQEMLVRSGVGSVLDGMPFEVTKASFSVNDLQQREKVIKMNLQDKVDVPTSELDKQNEAVLLENLKKIRDYFDKNMIQRIKTLKLNLRYGSEEKLRELAETLKLVSGTSLAARIADIEPLYTSSNRIFEVFLPLERGYLDWNTAQAIWRINQQLRPGDKANEWTLDKAVLEKIIKGYLTSY
ncbi:MAG: hypothetical protein WC838_04700 [Candidatus Margulisiibacteriota bacterium]|jgi:hypothetical protein